MSWSVTTLLESWKMQHRLYRSNMLITPHGNIMRSKVVMNLSAVDTSNDRKRQRGSHPSCLLNVGLNRQPFPNPPVWYGPLAATSPLRSKRSRGSTKHL